MRVLNLIRVGRTEFATFGILKTDGAPFAVTLELPWRNNLPGLSCIPAGAYVCRRIQSPKFGNTFEITNVPMRTHILFHKGNTTHDTEGCVLVGEAFEDGGIAYSGKGYAELMALLADVDEFMIIIHEV